MPLRELLVGGKEWEDGLNSSVSYCDVES